MWLAIASVGAAGLIVLRFGLPTLAALLFGLYGALGLDGLGHYTLALCSQHTFATNATIGFEVAAGLVLLVASTRWRGRRLSSAAPD